MASVCFENERFMVRVRLSDGRRCKVRLGRCSRQNAKVVKNHIERMEESVRLAMPLAPATQAWLDRVSDQLYDRLRRAHLCGPRNQISDRMTLAQMIDAYIARRIDLKPESLAALRTARNKLIAFFGGDRTLASFTIADAQDFHRAMRMKLARATTAKLIVNARQFFADAVNRELTTKNPFKFTKPGSQRNPDRQRFISRKVIAEVLAAMPTPQWRLIVTLARFGGLRVPSELRRLRWSHIDWESRRILIHSPKTEHHVGHATRIIPLFPEIAEALSEMKPAEVGTGDVIFTDAKLTTSNLRGRLLYRLKRASITPWPKIFQNLRSTRQTELAEHFPSHVVCAWLGNSEKIAASHYLQVTAEHFERAATLRGDCA